MRTLSISTAHRALCEISISGFCPVERVFKIFHISPTPSFTGADGLDVSVDSYTRQGVSDDFVLLLGDKQNDIASKITEFREAIEDQNIRWWRAPKYVLENIISERTYPTIGGHLQLGICMSNGFTPYSTCQPAEGEGSRAFLSYLGFNVSGDAQKVGNCFVGITGMA